MPTEREIFAHLVRAVIKLNTTPCVCSTGQYPAWVPGKCYVCDGVGDVRDVERVFRAGTAGTEVENDPRKRCHECEGAGLCIHCKGALESVPDEYSPLVMGGVLVSAFQGMSLLRGEERWGAFNEHWDIVTGWITRGMKLHPPDADELKRQLETMFGEPIQEIRPVTLAGGANSALTEDELRELGVLEDDGPDG